MSFRQDESQAKNLGPLSADENRPALPIELPPPPDLENLPPQVLHSGTVETLIGQNDDLMARLKVNIRRNAVLERQIMQHENANADLAHTNASLISQLQTLKEKDGLLREKANRAESGLSSVKSVTDQQRVTIAQLESDRFILMRAARYRDRIRKWVTPLVDNLKIQLATERKNLLKKEAQISDLRARLNEAAEHSQGLTRQASRDQTRLVEQYETQNKMIAVELESLRQANKLLREKALVVDQALKSDANSRNHIVVIERDNENLRQELGRANGLLKAAAVEKESLATDFVRTREQVDNLQILLAETQKRLELSKRQQDALNMLNQELSRQVTAAQAAAAAVLVDTNPIAVEPTKEINC